MKSFVIALLLGSLLASPAIGQGNMQSTGPSADKTRTQKRPGSHVWIERPWEARYILFATTAHSWSLRHARAAKNNAQPSQTYFFWEAFFDAAAKIDAPVGSVLDEALVVVPIEFDQQGFVLTTHSHAGRLRGRINRLRYVTLSSGDEPDTRNYNLGIWFTGLGDVSTDWAPGFCDELHVPNAALVRSELYLYGRLFKPDEFSTTFGCREWAYQLYDRERPYIDVTSYVPKGETYPHGSYIREFIGWARFEDHKPVIGKHGNNWYCLHDCPKDGKPGPIPDIRAWAQANGWPVPKRPKRMPVFPDPPGRQGTYPQ